MLCRVTSNFLLNSKKFKPVLSKAYSSYEPQKKIAVILSGCGVYDGSEIHEAVSVLSHITRNNARPFCFAPDKPQMHVINHLKGEEDKSNKRNVLEESARIARGCVESLSKLAENTKDYDAVVIPGGFGAAKNLSDYAVKGVDLTVHPDVERILKDFHCAKKPIGMICIAPIIAAKMFCNVHITLGKNTSDKWPHRGAIEDAKKLGALVQEMDVSGYVFDKNNIILSTPAFMYDGDYHEIDDGIGNLIKFIVVLLGQKYKN